MELTPEDRQRIYAEEKFRLEAQSAIKSEKKKSSGFTVFFGVCGLIAVAVVAITFIDTLTDTGKSRVVSHVASSSNADTVSYLRAFCDQAIIADLAMVNTSTLEGVSGTLRTVRGAEDSAYEKYVLSRGMNVDANAERADEVHRLFRGGLSEMILGAEGGGSQYIVTGGEQFKHSGELANAILRGITAQQ